MSHYGYITVLGGGKTTFYLPRNDEADEMIRDLAASVYHQQADLHRAHNKSRPATVLLPIDWLPADSYIVNKLAGAQILGVPIKVIADVDRPMFAWDLEMRKMP